LLNQDPPSIRRVWKRQVGDQRIGVDVLAPLCRVHIDYKEDRPRPWSAYLEFTIDEWDAIVQAVADKRHEILTRLHRTEDEIKAAQRQLDAKATQFERR